jgi:hypothetical protein
MIKKRVRFNAFVQTRRYRDSMCMSLVRSDKCWLIAARRRRQFERRIREFEKIWSVVFLKRANMLIT